VNEHNEFNRYTVEDDTDATDLSHAEIEALLRAGLIEQHHRLSTWDRPQFRLTESADILVTVRFQNDEREQDEVEGMTKFNVAMLRVALKIARVLAGVKS
jgi:hypothetical protein